MICCRIATTNFGCDILGNDGPIPGETYEMIESHCETVLAICALPNPHRIKVEGSWRLGLKKAVLDSKLHHTHVRYT